MSNDEVLQGCITVILFHACHGTEVIKVVRKETFVKPECLSSTSSLFPGNWTFWVVFARMQCPGLRSDLTNRWFSPSCCWTAVFFSSFLKSALPQAQPVLIVTQFWSAVGPFWSSWSWILTYHPSKPQLPKPCHVSPIHVDRLES